MTRSLTAVLSVLLLSTLFMLPTRAADPTTAPATQPSKIKVLIVTGGHPFDKKVFFPFFDKNPDITYTTITEGDFKKGTATAYDNPDLLNVDVVLLYDFQLNATPEEKKNFLAMFDKGTGLIVLHHALLSFQDWPDYERIGGGLYLLDFKHYGDKIVPESTYKGGVPMHVVVADKESPITKGISDFDLTDELYSGVHHPDDIHVLLTINDKPAAWTRTEKNSRIFGIILGHGKGSYDDPNFTQILDNAIKWTAKRD